MHDDPEASAYGPATEPAMYLMVTVDPDIAMIALENYIVATNSHEQRGRAIRALADFMGGGGGPAAPRS